MKAVRVCRITLQHAKCALRMRHDNGKTYVLDEKMWRAYGRRARQPFCRSKCSLWRTESLGEMIMGVIDWQKWDDVRGTGLCGWVKWDPHLGWRRLGIKPLNGTLSYHQISRYLEAARYSLKIIGSLWNSTGASTAVLSRRLSNFKAIW